MAQTGERKLPPVDTTLFPTGLSDVAIGVLAH